MAKLEAESGVTDERREVVADLATAIARGTIAPAAAVLDGDADPETIRAVARLYDLDTGG